jgi:hypothetical protein
MHQQETLASVPQDAASLSVRGRAVACGLAFAVIANAFEPVANYLIHSSAFARSHLPLGLLVAVLFLALVLNPILRTWKARWVFSRGDLAAVMAIGFFAGTIPNLALRVLAVISAPDYFASPENEWPTYVLPNLQRWLIPSNAGDGIAMFYRGIEPGRSFPLDAWAGPLLWWFSLIIALMGACLTGGVILRKQWSENERLAYPLVELPLLLSQDPEPGQAFPEFVRQRGFWIGFAVTAFILLWNTLAFFFPNLPSFGFLGRNMPLALSRGFPDLFIRFDPYIICFAWFTPLEILFSMWFFHVLGTVQAGVSNRIGVGPSDGGVVTQANYGFFIFVLWGLWMARSHVTDVWRKAVGKAPQIDDTSELLSYRTAAFGFLLAAVYIFFWLCRTRMSPFVALMFMLVTGVLYVGIAKIVALSGLVSLRWSGATGTVKNLVGIPNMSDTSVASLNQMGALYGVAKGFAMPGTAHGSRAAETLTGSRRRLGSAVFVGGIVALLVLCGVTLALGYYGPGAQNFGDYNYTQGNRDFFNYTVINIKNRAEESRDWTTVAFGMFGIAVTTLLILLNQRFPWWPLHPAGFTVSLQYPTRASFFSVFLAWLFKTIVLRVGGVDLYNRSRTVVLGAIVGYVVAVVIGFGLDVAFFWGQGHSLHGPP